MPMDIWLDANRRLRHAVARGTLTDRDLLEAWGDALADPAYDPAVDNLVDVSGAFRPLGRAALRFPSAPGT
ncbi:MAG: hypothetical protein ABR499_12940 [Gemmatimonadaceae bacterium]